MTVNWVSELIDLSGGALAKLASDSVKYIVAFGGALTLSLALTPLCRELARKMGMIDYPDARRINKTPIPRGGGLSIFLTFHVMCGLLVLGLGGPVGIRFSFAWQRHFLIASALLAAVGLLDDRFGVRPAVKLAGQVAVATILYLGGVSLGGIVVAFPPWLNYLATVLWVVGAINAFNLIDGMDGLATGLALIATVGLAGALLFTGNSADTLPFLVLAGASLGFLRYNFHPASVFLGDTGSMFLGLCVATMPLVTGTRKELVASLGVPLLAMGIPIFDTMLAIWRRTVRALLPQSLAGSAVRSRVMQPDKDHLHHRILRQTMNQRTAAIMLYCVSLALVAVGLAGTLLRNRAPGLFLIAFVAAIVVVVRHLERVELWDTGRLLSHKRSTIRQGLLVPLYVLVDAVSLCAVWLFARWALLMPFHRPAILTYLPIFVVPVFLALALTKTYSRVWSRAQVRDFAVLSLAVVGGSAVATGIVKLFGLSDDGLFRFALVFAALSVFPVAGVRLWRDSIHGLVQVLERRILMEKPGTVRALAYGGGVRFRSFLRELATSSGSGRNERIIVGLVDDDIHLKGRMISGYTVLGTVDELEELSREWSAGSLIITCLLDEEKQAQLVARAEAAGLRVSLWVSEERPLGRAARELAAREDA